MTIKRATGFTLIEIMLVLVLLSVSAVAVIATLPDNSDDLSKKQAQRFYQRFMLLNEEAVLSGKDFGIRVDESKSTYVYLTLTPDGWQELEMDRIPAVTELDESIALQLTLGGGAWGSDDRLFEPSNLFDENMFGGDTQSDNLFADEKKKKPQKPPQLFLLSSGELTPFVLAIYPNVGDAAQDGWRISVKETGAVHLLTPGESDEE